ncbi:MAG TPA: cysteine desulfurase family protein [Candidatus Paceibacterota bacterium]
MKRVYLDYASLTPVDKGVLKEMNKYSTKNYTNSSAFYASAVKARKAIESAKDRIAKVLHAHADEIIFTSGGTESNNLVLRSFEDKNIIISEIEHSSIIENAKTIGNAKVIRVHVGENGIINLEELKRTITSETMLVSIMMVNNEIGSVQPIREIAKIVRDARKKSVKDNEDKNYKYPLLHTDACQAMYLPLYVEKLGIDIMTLDGNKIYGPRGVGMLYIKRGTVKISRPGTENISGIMGFATALEIADKMREKEHRRLIELKDFFIKGLYEKNKDIKVINGQGENDYQANKHIKINGVLEGTSPHILNISIPNIDNDFFILQLSHRGVECSTKSACLNDKDESYVLNVIGAQSKHSVRFSFGRDTTKSDIKYALKKIDEILEKTL